MKNILIKIIFMSKIYDLLDSIKMVKDILSLVD